MKTVAVNPADIDAIPFDSACDLCVGLRDDPQPGLMTWVGAVGTHMQEVHETVLVGA